MWIKICGNTSLADAQHAATVGASAVGFVFAPSPRRVTVDQVRVITPHLPRNVERIGVFVNASFDEIVATVEDAGLTGVQLHVNEDPTLPCRLRARYPATALSILRVLAYGQDIEQQLAAAEGEADADAVLVDSRTATAHGGTGIAFDWQAAQRSFRDRTEQLRIIAAGGLSPENVEQAIATLRPWGVDVVSGVEAAPGRKDPARVAAFVRSARQAFAAAEASSPLVPAERPAPRYS